MLGQNSASVCTELINAANISARTCWLQLKTVKQNEFCVIAGVEWGHRGRHLCARHVLRHLAPLRGAARTIQLASQIARCQVRAPTSATLP